MSEAIDTQAKSILRGKISLVVSAISRYEMVYGKYPTTIKVGKDFIEACSRVAGKEWRPFVEGEDFIPGIQFEGVMEHSSGVVLGP